MKKILAALFVLWCGVAQAQNYLRDDGIFHSVVEGTINGQLLVNNGGNLGGTNSPSGAYSWSGNQYFGSGVPWIDVKSGTHGCAAAAGNGSTDDTAAIQCQLNWSATNLGGGEVYLPNGSYLVSGGGLTVKAGTVLQGAGKNVVSIIATTDTKLVTLDAATCKPGIGIADLTIQGYINVAATQDVITVGSLCQATISRNIVVGGHHGLNTAGFDGTYTDNNFCGWTGDNVYSTGANWYFSDKLDQCGNPSTGNAFEQGPTSGGGSAENYFYRLDVSCTNCTNSIKINDGDGTDAITYFYGAVAAKPIVITNARTTAFIGGEFGSSSFSGSGNVIISGIYASFSTTPSGGTYNCNGNFNVNCSSTTPVAVGTITGLGTGVATALGDAANASGGFVTSPVANGNLANPSTTVNGQTCALGSTCTVTAAAANTLTFGTHLTSGGASYNGSAPVTITPDATAANTASTIVARDSSGNFTAGTITAALTGTASAAPLSGITGLGTGVATALATNTGTTGAVPTITAATNWTPTDASGASLVLVINFAKWYAVGKLTTIIYSITYPTTVSGSVAIIGGLPASILTGSANLASCLLSAQVATVTQISLGGGGATTAVPQTPAGVAVANSVLSGLTVAGSCTYLAN